MSIAQITVPSFLYAKLQKMADGRSCTVAEVAGEFLDALAGLSKEDQDLLLRTAKLLKQRSQHPEWAEIVELAVDRAEARKQDG